MMKKNQINEFTSIRFFWAAMVAMSHIYGSWQTFFPFPGNEIIKNWGGCSVTCFFIMSGFLMCMHYGEKSFDMRVGTGFAFAKKHIVKWYLLYIICTLPQALLDGVRFITSNHLANILEYLARIFLNLFLMQAWIPDRNYSINSVTWFLSCLFALYIVTPLLLNLTAKLKHRNMLVMAAAVFILIIYFLSDYNGTELLYYHPSYRVLQYTLGMIVYKFIRNVRKENRSWAVYLAFALQGISFMMVFKPFFALSICISTVILISCIFLNSGKNFFQNRILVKLGSVSMELYLIHPVVSGFGVAVFRRIAPLTRMWGGIEMLFVMAVSMLLAFLYHFCQQKMKGSLS